MKKYAFIFVLMLCSVSTKAQTLLEKIVDSSLVKEQHEFILSKLDSAFFFDHDKHEFVRPFEPENCVICDVYNCRSLEGGGNLFFYEEGLIDTNLFTKKYFVSGKFLEDWVDLKEQGKAKIELFDPYSFVFDTVNDKAYTFPESKPRLEKIHYVSINLDTIYKKFGYPIQDFSLDENYIGKLYKTKTIDFVFRYPTFIHYDPGFSEQPYISWELSYCFGMQGNQFFYIDTWGKKIYPMEEVVENHWDWITNVKQK